MLAQIWFAWFADCVNSSLVLFCSLVQVHLELLYLHFDKIRFHVRRQ